MRRFSKAALYGHQLFWSVERDRLDAHFLRFGSGFMTENNVKEALESMEKINQILIQYQNGFGSQIKFEKTPLPLQAYDGRVENSNRE